MPKDENGKWVSSNPFSARRKQAEKQPVAYHRAPKMERDTAKKLGARQISGSGAGVKKGDVYIPGIARVECKATAKKSFSVTLDMFDKISNVALLNNELPIIEVEFVSPLGKRLRSFAVMDMNDLTELIGQVNEKAPKRRSDAGFK